MDSLDLADPELAIIINMEGNKICNDCKKINPRWCSINNAVFLCASCTRKHRKFEPRISNIKSLEGDLWTKDEIKKLYIGGNERFNKLMESYNIPLTLENSKYKYHTKIAEYYRNLLNEEIKGKKIIDIIKPNLKEGIEIIDKDNYDKLDQYAPSQDNIINNNNINMNNNSSNILNIPKKEVKYVNPFATEQNLNNINSNINNINTNIYNNNRNSNNNEFNIEKEFNNFADSMSNVITNISQKAQSIDYNEKLRNAGEYLKDQKEKIENSDTFKSFMNTLSKGFDSFLDAADNFFNNNEYNINQQRRNANIHDNRNQNQVQFQGQRINNLNQGYMSSNMNYSGNNGMNNQNNVNMNFGNNIDINPNNENMGNNNDNKENNKNDNMNSQNNSMNNYINNNGNDNNIDINFYNNTPFGGKNVPNINESSQPEGNINSMVESQNNNINVESLDEDHENNENKI